jgi:MFS family permease
MRSGRPASAFVVLAALVLAEVVSAVEATMIFAALRTFFKLFGDAILVGWIVTAFLLVAAASAAVCARLGDMYGRKRVLLIVLAVAFLGSLVSALSVSVEGIILGRAIQGLSGAILPLCFGIARENLPEARVPFGVGVVAAAAFVTAGCAIFLGGVIIDHASWQWIFYVGAGSAVVAFVAISLAIPSSRPAVSGGRLDILGALLLVPAIGGLLLAVSQGKTWGWADPKTLGLALASVAILVLWARHELRLDNPLIDVRLLGNRQIALGNLCAVLIALGPLQQGMVLSLLYQQPQWTSVGLGLSASAAGLFQAPALMLALFAAPWCSVLAARHGARRPVLFACHFLALGWIAIAFHHESVAFVATMALVHGLGSAMAYVSIPMLIVEIAPAERTSEATGLSSVLRFLFTAIGSQLVAFMLATSTVTDAAQGPGTYPAPSAYALTLGFIASMSVLSILVTLGLPKRGARYEVQGTRCEAEAKLPSVAKA